MASPSTRLVRIPFYLLAVAATLLATALAGCTSPGIVIPFVGKSETSSLGSRSAIARAKKKASSSPDVARHPGRYPLAQVQKNSLQRLADRVSHKSDSEATYPGAKTVKKISSSLRHAAASLTPAPKVVPADDPTRLASKTDSLSPQVFVTSARLLEHQGDSAEAAAQYRKALEIAPEDRSALIGYARLEHRLGNLQEAVQLYGRAIDNAPNDAVALNDLGLCLARMGRIDESISTLARAVQAQPASPRYRNNISSLLVEVGRIDEALANLQPVHGLAKAHYNVGYLLKQRGKNQQAMQQFAMAIQVDPTLEEAQAMLTQLGGNPAPMASRRQTPYRATAVGSTPASPSTPAGQRPPTSYGRAASYQAPATPTAPPPGSIAPGPAPRPNFLQQPRETIGPFGYDPVSANRTPQPTPTGRKPVLRIPQPRVAGPSANAPLPPTPSW